MGGPTPKSIWTAQIAVDGLFKKTGHEVEGWMWGESGDEYVHNTLYKFTKNNKNIFYKK